MNVYSIVLSLILSLTDVSLDLSFHYATTGGAATSLPQPQVVVRTRTNTTVNIVADPSSSNRISAIFEVAATSLPQPQVVVRTRSDTAVKIVAEPSSQAGTISVNCATYNPQYHVEALNERSELGEGPYWDDGQQLLYWVDMRNMWINSYSPDTGVLHKATIDTDKKPVTFVIRVKGTQDKFVVGIKSTLALIQWDGKSDAHVKPMEFLDMEDPKGKSRCNDAKVDPSNRLWVETMGAQTKSDPKGNEFEKDKGNVYRIDYDGSKHQVINKMQIPNGLVWSLDKTKFYLVDSLGFDVTEYNYDDKTGGIVKVKKLYNLQKNSIVGTPDKPNSLPDGMTIDAEGMLWVGVYGTGKVIRIDPKTSQKIFEIQLDQVLQPTSVCFGGKNLDTLYVTSAHVDWTDELEKKYPKSGYTFKITNLGVKGAGPSMPAKLPDATVAKCCVKE